MKVFVKKNSKSMDARTLHTALECFKLQTNNSVDFIGNFVRFDNCNKWVVVELRDGLGDFGWGDFDISPFKRYWSLPVEDCLIKGENSTLTTE